LLVTRIGSGLGSGQGSSTSRGDAFAPKRTRRKKRRLAEVGMTGLIRASISIRGELDCSRIFDRADMGRSMLRPYVTCDVFQRGDLGGGA
jgi:hypothetical protein